MQPDVPSESRFELRSAGTEGARRTHLYLQELDRGRLQPNGPVASVSRTDSQLKCDSSPQFQLAVVQTS